VLKICCDICLSEISNSVVVDQVTKHPELESKVSFSIKAYVNSRPKGGHLCILCLKSEINKYIDSITKQYMYGYKRQKVKTEALQDRKYSDIGSQMSELQEELHNEASNS
jgi:hypothetical protein